MIDLTPAERLVIRRRVDFVGRLSDNLIHLGPFSLGLDGVLSWVPGLGEVYSVVAGVYILVQGVRAGVPPGVLVAAGLILGLRSLATVVPIAGAAFSDVFTAHKWAAAMIVRAIDQQVERDAARSCQAAYGASIVV